MRALQVALCRPGKGRSARAMHLAIVLFAAIVLLPALSARAQDASQQGVPDMGQNTPIAGHSTRHGTTNPTQIDDENPYRDAIREAQLKAARQKALIDDTNKLLKLAAQLNDEIGGTETNPIDKDQLRKVAQIQKLAHSVEQNMKFSLTLKPSGPDQYPPPQIPDPHQHNPR